VHFKCSDLNSSMRVTVYTECIYVLTEYLKYLAYEGVVIFFGKMWVGLKKAGRCVVAFGGSVNCACVPHSFQQLINTTLCLAFLRKFVCQPLCWVVYLFKYRLFKLKSCHIR